VRLSSKESEFEIDLPKNYYLDNKWKVALTSFNYPTDILQLPDDRDSRTISVATKKDGAHIEHFVLPNIHYENVDALLEQMNIILSRYSSRVVSANNPANNLRRLKFGISNGVVIVLPIDLAKMLGCEPDQHLLVETKNLWSWTI